MKKRKIIVIAIMLIVIALVLVGIIIKPSYELNKAVKYVKNGEYIKAYTYISDKKNDNNTRIVSELISIKLITSMRGGLEQINTILNKAIEIVQKTDFNNIDYSLDDNLNIYVEKLEDYIKLKNDIPKDILITDDKIYETYDSYFQALEFVNSNFINVLNNIKNNHIKETEINQISLSLETISVNMTSMAYNYNFDVKTKQIYKEMLNEL